MILPLPCLLANCHLMALKRPDYLPGQLELPAGASRGLEPELPAGAELELELSWSWS